MTLKKDPGVGLEASWDVSSLQLFVRVAEVGSLTRLASESGLPQPAISRKISKLEQQCGGYLFLRTGRGMVLSEFGQRILPRVRAALHELSMLGVEVGARSSTLSGTVRIGILSSICKPLIAPLIAQQIVQLPGVVLQIHEGAGGQIDRWLTNGTVDIGVTYRYGQKPRPDETRLLGLRSYLVGSHGDPHLQHETIPFRNLDGLPLVLPSAPSAVRTLLNRHARQQRIRLNVVAEADSGQNQKAAASQRGIYTIVPIHAVVEDLELKILQATRIVQPEVYRYITLCFTSAQPLSQAAREISNLIRGLLGRHQSSILDGDMKPRLPAG